MLILCRRVLKAPYESCRSTILLEMDVHKEPKTFLKYMETEVSDNEERTVFHLKSVLNVVVEITVIENATILIHTGLVWQGILIQVFTD